jgi:hypothetical protein
MTKLVDMKYSAKEKAERNRPGIAGPTDKYDGPDYPYGLNLTLEHDHLKKLGLIALPKVGSYVNVNARALVVSVRQSESTKGKPNRCVELQLQKIGVGKDGPSSAVEAIDYGIDDAE